MHNDAHVSAIQMKKLRDAKRPNKPTPTTSGAHTYARPYMRNDACRWRNYVMQKGPTSLRKTALVHQMSTPSTWEMVMALSPCRQVWYMYICIHTYIYIYIYIHVCMCACMCVCVFKCRCYRPGEWLWLRVHADRCDRCIYVYTHTHVYACMYVCMYVCVCDRM